MEPLLVVGAGPTGLAAALFLSKAGIRRRVIDKAASTSRYLTRPGHQSACPRTPGTYRRDRRSSERSAADPSRIVL
jgi:2-polyprenyl-6-methoxyphenol hydroxylase-like FAD-dependent oxidoreductase